MGKLDELEEELYGKEADAMAGRRKRQFPLVPTVRNIRNVWAGDEMNQSPFFSPRGSWKRMMIFAAVGAALFVAGGLAFLYFYIGTDRREAEIAIGGPSTAEAGQSVTIPITFRNVSSSPLEDAELALAFPARALIKDATGLEHAAEPRTITHIGTLQAGEERTQDIALRMFGHEGEEQEINVSLLYRPAKLSAQFSSQAKKQITISRVPLEIFWDVPDTVSPRQQTKIALRFASQASAPFDGLWLRIDYPPGFTPAGVDPKPAVGDFFWNIGTFDPGKEEKIMISGMFDGAAGESKAMRAGLGAFNELTKEWHPWRESAHEITLAASPFLLAASIQGKRAGVIRPGEEIEVAVRYENRSAVPVKNISVRATLEGAIADLASIRGGDGGVFDSQARAVVWGPGGTDALREVAPGSGKDLHFTVSTKARPVMRTQDDKNLTLRVRASIVAPDVPQELQGAALNPGDTVELKVATIALLSGRAVFRSSPILNTGPLPPRVGEKTSYTIIWEARNFTNEIENAQVRATLPPNIRWENATFPRDAQVSFDASASEVRWHIGRLGPGTGVLTPSLTAAFQVSVVPSVPDAGKTIALVTQGNFSGRDTFTGQDIAGTIAAFTTELHDDPATSEKDWRVLP